MPCNVDVLDVPARPTVAFECDRGMPVTATSRPTAAMEQMIKGFMRNLLSARNHRSDLISAKPDVGV